MAEGGGFAGQEDMVRILNGEEKEGRLTTFQYFRKKPSVFPTVYSYSL